MFVANFLPKILNSRSIHLVCVKILFMSLFCFGSHFDMFITKKVNSKQRESKGGMKIIGFTDLINFNSNEQNAKD